MFNLVKLSQGKSEKAHLEGDSRMLKRYVGAMPVTAAKTAQRLSIAGLTINKDGSGNLVSVEGTEQVVSTFLEKFGGAKESWVEQEGPPAPAEVPSVV